MQACKMQASARAAAPFVKWVGGKRQLLPEIQKRLPARIVRYYEPFVGGGAVFFGLIAPRAETRIAFLSDANEELVNAYHVVRDQVDELALLLRLMPRDRDYFAEVRRTMPEDLVARAARFIYLNKCGFNGLYRVNRKGEFNVPFGDNSAPVCDEEGLRAASAALRRIAHGPHSIRALDVREVEVGPGDVIYCDPPYVPLSATSSFTGYTDKCFGLEEQKQLRDAAVRWRKDHAFVLLSNSGSPVVRELYESHGFRIDEVDARRAINSKGDRRGPVKEVLIY